MKKLVKSLSPAIVLVLGVAMFTGCMPSTAEKASANLKDAGYVVDSTVASAVVRAMYKNVDDVVWATNGDEAVIIVYFDSASAAKDSQKDIQSLKDRYFKDQKDENVKSGRSGKMLYVGTKKGVKDCQ